jgi:NAD(P)H-flavin reductase
MNACGDLLPRPHRVAGVRRETPDTATLILEPEQEPARPFLPGQFSMLYVFGVGEAPISISGDPELADRLSYTVRAVGPVTRALVRSRPGDLIGVRGPFGLPWPVREAAAKDIVVVAGGLGLAPLRPAIYAVLRRRADFGSLTLFYGARSARDLLFRRELAAWRRNRHMRVETTVDHADLRWRGHVGVVTNLFREARLRPAVTMAWVCGPEIMMRFVARELRALGVAAGSIYLSLERNMQCATGHCGHCQFGPFLLCKHGPVLSYEHLRPWMGHHEL